MSVEEGIIVSTSTQPSEIEREKISEEEETSQGKEISQEEKILAEMTDEEKVGQLFIFGFDGTTLSPEKKEFLQKNKIGGVLLLSKNISDEIQLKKLVDEIQATNNIPLFISIDQEGGAVSRIQWDERLSRAQSEIKDPEEAYRVGEERGKILKELGINMNFAPVVEYITNPDSFMYNRVYTGSREDVSKKSIATIQGYTASQVLAVPKHYPGHSNTSPDSHYYLPVVDIDNSQWEEYINPFTTILEQTDVDALMVGHIKYPQIDNSPSSISSEIINNRLIEQLNYNGLVISDDMEMNALENLDTYTNIAKQALLAGNDILIYSKYSNRHPQIQRDVYNYILQEVKDGNMNIDNKVLKILRTKIKYNILPPGL